MADARDQPCARKGIKRPAQKRARPSANAKKLRHCHQKLTNARNQRFRVNIGLAFEKWRVLKANNGLRSDEDVAMSLLDAMKTEPSTSSSSEPEDKKMKFSQSEVQAMIEQEVHAVVEKSENKLRGLVGTIKELDRDVDYESSIRNLEIRIDKLTKRAEAAMVYMKAQKKNPLPGVIRADSVETASQTDSQSVDKSEGLFRVIETTKMALKMIHEDDDALKAAITDFREKLPPSVFTPRGSPGRQDLAIKTDPEQTKEVQNTVEESRQCEEPKADTMKDKLLYPPLPCKTFPSSLNMEVAAYNIPQTPLVRLALIRNPASLSVLWNVEEEDPCAPPMESYGVFVTMEKVKGSNVFPDWTVIDVEARSLPMCMRISKYKPGRKVCVAVVGKDKFGRHGSYSKVVTASLPD